MSPWWSSRMLPRRVIQRCCALVTLLATVGLSACSTLPPRSGSAALRSQAVPLSTQTPLGRLATATVLSAANDDADLTSSMPGGRSGFRLLPLGTVSLDARLQLVRRAQDTLDLQYYHFAADSTGRALMRALRDAAARGVRVRLLIDDLYTGGHDALWAGLAAHPQIEVRLFNPFIAARGGGPLARFAAAPWQWGRINHRMHNKLFVADGALAVFGGRNVADEYYLKSDADNFIDVDVLAVGAVVPDLQAQFDRYWNAPTAYPLHSIVAQPADDIEAAALRVAFDEATAPARAALAMPDLLPPRDVLGQPPIGRQLDDGRLTLLWGRAQVLADDPQKPFQGAPGGELMNSSVTHAVYASMQAAQHEVVASSPYFVPGRVGLDLLTALRSRGVQIRVLTNSLASTDEPVVHLAYTRYRPGLLAAGVQLYELSQRRVKDNMLMFLFGASLGRLHAKTVVIDRRRTYIGSMNLDPRSATLNTELGALIDSPALAAQALALIEIDRLHSAYALRLDDAGGCCRWVLPDSDGSLVLTTEPDAPWWLRWLGGWLQPLVPEDHL